MSRAGSASCSNSEIGLTPMNLSNVKVLPEQWTLPQEWNIEKRELFQNWKLDVQNQINFLDRQLGHSLNKYPVLEPIRDEDAEELERQKELLIGKMQLGLKRA